MKHKLFVSLMAIWLSLGICIVARGQEKPLNKDQVLALVHNKMGDDAGAKAVEASGIDFEPTADFLSSLKKAGASDTFLQALRAAHQPKPAGSGDLSKSLSQQQILELLSGDVPSSRVAMLVGERGLDFKPTDAYLTTLEGAGAESDLLDALRVAKPPQSLGSATNPGKVISAPDEGKQTEVQQHLMRGLQYRKKQQFTEAEQEYRAATQIDPKNANVWVALATTYNMEGKSDDAIAAAHHALELNPGLDRAHLALGVGMGTKGDHEGAAAEFRKASTLNPNNEMAHDDLGVSLLRQGKTDEAIVEFRDALRANPRDEHAHNGLGNALRKKGNLAGAIFQFREAIRIRPKNDLAHMNLGAALEQNGKPKLALEQYRIASELKPENHEYRQAYEKLQQRSKK
ncbi:MAG TPA: tetratricopeptide repeat protein [Terriglobia bacterium]|nr:tetratricopeptide repeat protein [Terriglobia bacterium]